MNNNNTRENHSPSKKPPQIPMALKIIDSFLRLSIILLSAVTFWLTLTNHQLNPDYGNLDYRSIKGLKFIVVASGISAVYALLSFLSSWISCLVSKAWLFFVPDQVIAYLMTISVAGVAEIVFLLKEGDVIVSWSEMCSAYQHFCFKLNVALGLHASVLLSFFILSAISAYRVFSLFDSPIPHHQNQTNTHA